VPIEAINLVSAARTEWLVPGMLKEKITTLIKSLPKAIRTNFIPAPEFADRALELFFPAPVKRRGDRR